MFRSILKEPLTHFLALALAIFVIYGLLNPSEGKRPDRILISKAKIEQLAAVYTSTWQRPPTVTELKGLVDDYLKEEIYYREALALGLDKDDTIIRRRLRNKMEYLNQAAAESVLPAEAELEAFLKANPKKFEIEPAIAFRHVFFSPEKRGSNVGEDAAALLTRLLSNAEVSLDPLGDATLLPDKLPLTGKAAIGKMFGPEFADAIDQILPGKWAGPLASAYGLHIVLVSERQPSRHPPIGEVRDAVAREWANEKRHAIDEARFSKLLKQYEVIIESTPQPKVAR